MSEIRTTGTISTSEHFLKSPPRRVKIPADHPLVLAIIHLKAQLGSKQAAYNELVLAAEDLLEEIQNEPN